MADDRDDSPVNWDHYQVKDSRAAIQDPEQFTALGDPSAWSGSGKATIASANVITRTPQLIRVQCKDPYARNWQMLGTMKMSAEMFASTTDAGAWFAVMQITMGVGMRDSVIHWVNLRALLDLASPPALYPTFNQWYLPVAEGDDVVMPWVMPGALVGRAINVQVLFVIPDPERMSLPQVPEVTAMISPFSAGHYL